MQLASMEQLSPSQITLLKGEHFVRRRGRVELPSGLRVSSRELSQRLITVALLACASHEVLDLQVRPQRELFGVQIGSALFAEPRTQSVPWSESSLEAWLTHLAVQLQAEDRNRVRALVYLLLREHSPDPWRRVVAITQGGLAAMDIVQRVEERRAHSARRHRIQVYPAMADPVAHLPTAHVEELLHTCRSAAPQIWYALRREVSQGIRYRRKVEDPSRQKTLEEEWDDSFARLVIGE
jgi:hypothetical protein